MNNIKVIIIVKARGSAVSWLHMDEILDTPTGKLVNVNEHCHKNYMQLYNCLINN